ncbi:MAG: 5-amino-6-(D-ribitylamino)uracil--L-tyrosine 4-hydroxyphenyl transferase CofH, partial [Bauldia litoralis]
MNALLKRAASGRVEDDEALRLVEIDDLPSLLAVACDIRNAGYGSVVTYSRKVFIPLTQLCRDVCHYCTFAHPPRRGERAYLTVDEAVAVAEAGQAAGCTEALLTLGDKPELRYRTAREELAALGHATTLSYLREVAAAIFARTGLFPHLNPGLMEAADLSALRPVSASMGIMLETTSARLSERGGPHFGSPDKEPAARLTTIERAGEAVVPFTSGLLIGIGETRRERVEAMLALRAAHERHGHIQEIIVQNFRAKPGTRMADAPEPSTEDHLWTIAVARLIFGPAMSIQAPPNLAAPGELGRMIAAGINDWGGVSPVTPDYVNPEAPWPHLKVLEAATEAAGKSLAQRLPIYPAYLEDGDRWLVPELRVAALHRVDAAGLVRDSDWSPGIDAEPPHEAIASLDVAPATGRAVNLLIDRAVAGERLEPAAIASLFAARGGDLAALCAAADELRRAVNGDAVSYVVTRNINYTNVCTYKCRFCAFSKGKLSENLRGTPYDLTLDEIERRTREAWERGATEVCMQGGIHPDFTGATYLDICRSVKAAAPGMHIHAFSPLEIWQGAATLGVDLEDYFAMLREAGLGTLPGTAAEILDDDVRAILCPDKIRTGEWLQVMRAAHQAGFRTTSTIMFGHMETPLSWARHLLAIRDLQVETGGFTEFVPLPFVHMEAPMYLKGLARRGPTFREAVLMHAVGRLVLHPHVPNIQVSWVQMGAKGA